MSRHMIETNIDRLPRSCRNIIEDTLDLATQEKFKVKLHKTKYIWIDPETRTLPCQGFFYEEGRTLEVATRRPYEMWIGVFTHESCHFDQCLERTRIWRNGDRVSEFDDWVMGNLYLPPAKLWKYKRFVQHLELDCEIRTVEKIKQYDLPIDVKLYTQKANAYVWFYHASALLHRWSIPGRPPYENPDVVKRMPKRFLDIEEYQEMPSAMLKAYDRAM